MSSSNALSTTAMTRMPALTYEDDRLIIGRFIQYIDNRVRGGWLRHDTKAALPEGRRYLGLDTRRALQQFVDRVPQVITARPGEELPDADELNSKIPKEEWPIGLNGQPEPPWHKEFIVYLLDLSELAVLTFANHTIGAIRAVTDLEESWKWARGLYGRDAKPLITLTEAPFPTGYGERKRPIFNAPEWRVFREGALRPVDQSVLMLAAPPAKPRTETMEDAIPY